MPVKERPAKLAFFVPLPRPGLRASPQTPCRLERRHSVSGFIIGQRAIVSSTLGSGHGILLRSNGWHRSNNSFKPSPLRGLVCVPLHFHPHKAAKRSVLTQALDRSRRECRSTSVRPRWCLLFRRLVQVLIHATNSVPARAPALRFWVRHFAKSGFRPRALIRETVLG